MALQHILKNSSQSGKEPTASQLANGELALNYHADGPFLTCKDTTGVVRRIAGVWVNATAPGSPTPGQLWLDISITPNQLKVYKDSTDNWVLAGNVLTASTTDAGVVELATNAETQAGSDSLRAVTPASLQSKISDSTVTVSATTIASSSAVKTTYDLANAALPKSGGTVTGALEIGTTGSLSFEGATANDFETTLAVVDPTADRTITLPNVSGTVVTSGDSGTVTSTMLAGSIADSKLSTISSADKVSLSALNIDGGTDIGTALADADLIIVDDGGNGTNRKAAATRITDYAFGKISGDITTTSAGVTTIKSSVALAGSPTAQTQAAGTSNTTLATTAFVMAAADAARQGLTVKQACRVATTANISLSGTQTVDGVAVIAGDRVLVKNQTTAAENGIYVCAASSWSRATDFDADADLLDGAFTFVEEGSSNADSGWVLTTNGPITVGVTSLAFAQFSGAGQITAGSGLAKTANTLSVASGGITSDMIADGAIVNADINASAAIAGTKISPDFGSQNIVTTGNVGIGTSSPSSLLQIYGDNPEVKITQNPVIPGNAGLRFDAAGTAAAYINFRNSSQIWSSTTGDSLFFGNGNRTSTFLTVDPIGRLGIGTSSPTQKLDVAGGSITTDNVDGRQIGFAVGDTFSASVATANYGITRGAAGNNTVGLSGYAGLSLYTNTLERLRLNSSGYFYHLGPDFAATFQTAAGAGTTYALITGGHTATSISTVPNACFRVWSNGDVVNTNNSYTAISDVKLKENIVDANSQWADIKALQVRNYNFKEGQTHTQIGLIAQEVEPISPGLVYESPDRDEDGNDLGTATKSVNYSVLYMKAVKALQEAMERIETLEQQVATLLP